MFSKLKRFVLESSGNSDDWLRSLCKRNARAFLKNDSNYDSDIKSTLSDYFASYIDDSIRELIATGQITPIQKHLDDSYSLGDDNYDRTSAEAAIVMDEFSDRAVGLLAFCNCFCIPAEPLRFHCYALSPEWYLDYIFNRKREGAYFMAAIILRYHPYLGGIENNSIANKVFSEIGERAYASSTLGSPDCYLDEIDLKLYKKLVSNADYQGYKIIYKNTNNLIVSE